MSAALFFFLIADRIEKTNLIGLGGVYVLISAAFIGSLTEPIWHYYFDDPGRYSNYANFMVSENAVATSLMIRGVGPGANQSFEQSVGLLPYPITFLVTDIISEIYGKKK